jgi:hypothetical protein
VKFLLCLAKCVVSVSLTFKKEHGLWAESKARLKSSAGCELQYGTMSCPSVYMTTRQLKEKYFTSWFISVGKKFQAPSNACKSCSFQRQTPLEHCRRHWTSASGYHPCSVFRKFQIEISTKKPDFLFERYFRPRPPVGTSFAVHFELITVIWSCMLQCELLAEELSRPRINKL